MRQRRRQRLSVEGKPEIKTPPPEVDSTTEHSIVVGGQTIAYKAVAGTITVGGTDTYDAMLGLDGKLLPDSGMNPLDAAKPEDWPATARIFYNGLLQEGCCSGDASCDVFV